MNEKIIIPFGVDNDEVEIEYNPKEDYDIEGIDCLIEALEGEASLFVDEEYDYSQSKLTPKQELFCITFASPTEFFGNGLQSYAFAYGIDLNTKGNINTAKSNAYKLLTKTYITKRIAELIDENGLNDVNVDKQLLIAVQQCADFSSKVAAIREYNKLRKRIVDKIEHSGPDGKPIETKDLSEKSPDKIFSLEEIKLIIEKTADAPKT